MKRPARRFNRKGLSLITALVAMVILSVAMLGVADVFLRSLRNNGTAASVTGLSQLAGRVTEMMMLLPDDSPLLQPGTVNPETQLGLTTSGPGTQYDKALYNAAAVVTDSGLTSPSGGSLRLVKVEVRVKYTTTYAASLGADPNIAGVTVVTYRYRSN